MSSSELEDLSDIDLLDEPEGEPSHLDKCRLEADSISLKNSKYKGTIHSTEQKWL